MADDWDMNGNRLFALNEEHIHTEYKLSLDLTIVYTAFPVDVTNLFPDCRVHDIPRWCYKYPQMMNGWCPMMLVTWLHVHAQQKLSLLQTIVLLPMVRETGTEHHVDVCTVQSADYYLVHDVSHETE